MKRPNRLSKFCITKKTGMYGGVNRATDLSDLRREILSRTNGNGKKSIGVYVKIAELPDNISEPEVFELLCRIEKDYKDPE